MGLPIWRDPEETRPTAKKTGPASRRPYDPVGDARSSIRRRGAISRARRGAANSSNIAAAARSRVRRDPGVALLPPLLERSPPQYEAVGVLRDSRRGNARGVPPIGTLLESIDQQHPSPAQTAPNQYEPTIAELENRENSLRSTLDQLRERANERANNFGHFIFSNDPAAVRAFVSDMHAMSQRRSDQSRDTAPQTRSELESFRERWGITEQEQQRRERDLRDVREAYQAGRNTLPTPPHDTSENRLMENESTSPPPSLQPPPRQGRRLHPLSRSWHPDTGVDGLGDRIRSPTPTDGWEIIRTTITPDPTLPSAESSFTSAAASRSFNSNHETDITEPENFPDGNRQRQVAETSSNLDPDDLPCYDDEVAATETFAEEMYFHEMGTPEGRERIVEQQAIRRREGNRFALSHEPDRVDLGFRLIEEALESEAGRERLTRIGLLGQEESTVSRLRAVGQTLVSLDMRRADTETLAGLEARQADTSNRGTINDDTVPPPRPDRYSASSRAAVREASEQVHNYFRRFAAPLQTQNQDHHLPSTSSDDQPAMEVEISRDAPEPHAVNPTFPPPRTEEELDHTESRDEASDMLGSGDETELAALRRLVERLARRGDVPDEWWNGIGLNLSRTRPARADAAAARLARAGERVRRGQELAAQAAAAAEEDRSTSGRGERRDARL